MKCMVDRQSLSVLLLGHTRTYMHNIFNFPCDTDWQLDMTCMISTDCVLPFFVFQCKQKLVVRQKVQAKDEKVSGSC